MVLTEGVHALPEAMAPWKDLTDRFDDLSDWFDRLEGKVERDLAAMERQEVAGGDLSDFIVAVKVSHPSSRVALWCDREWIYQFCLLLHV